MPVPLPVPEIPRPPMLCTLLLSFFLEIVTVTATWNPGICNDKCGEMLGKALNKNGAIQKIDLTSGKVVMYWKPNAPFNYQTLKRNFQSVGVGLNLTPYELKVRGTVFKQGGDVVLVSIGDNTRFNLIGPAPVSSNQYVSRGTIVNRKLQGELLDQVELAMKNRAIVEVTGGLYLPETPPMRLAVNKLTIVNPEQ